MSQSHLAEADDNSGLVAPVSAQSSEPAELQPTTFIVDPEATVDTAPQSVDFAPKLDLASFAADSSILQGLRLQMQQAVYQQFNGSLSFEVESGYSYDLVFRLGRIVWATGGKHRFRRWHRLVGEHCPAIASKVLKLQALQPSHIWEYQILIRLLAQQRINRDQVSTLIKANIAEVLSDLLREFNQVSRTQQLEGSSYKVDQPIIIPSISELLRQAKQQCDYWEAARLEICSPDCAPMLVDSQALENKVSAKTYRVLIHLLKGQASLRELTRILPQNLVQLSQTLSVYAQQNIIRFETLPDFPAPWPNQARPAQVPPTAQLPLVCCVDDNPLVGRSMGQIVQKLGYRYLYVQDSVKALQEIIEKKPALIFIDLVMPVISGYELCSQVRRIAQFRDTPLMILTGNDGVVDRVRSKMVGSTEFITKPVAEQKVATALKRYIDPRKSQLMVSESP